MKTKVLFFISLFLTILVSSSPALAQSSVKDEVVLTVSGEGKTTDEATKTALRSAISQAYGVFVSANTTLLNDDLVKDEIATITSGNIKNYEEVSNVTLQNSIKSVTLKATVCISKLVSYAKSKGASTEFAGATFGMNMKMKELDKANEEKALNHLMDILAATLPYCYDLKCDVGEPFATEQSNFGSKDANKTYDIPITVAFVPNQNASDLQNIFMRTLQSISLSSSDYEEYRRQNLHPHAVFFYPKYENREQKDRLWRDFKYSVNHAADAEGTVRFRNDIETIRKIQFCIKKLALCELFNFEFFDNVGNKIVLSYEGNEGRINPKDIKVKANKVLPFTIALDPYVNTDYDYIKDHVFWVLIDSVEYYYETLNQLNGEPNCHLLDVDFTRPYSYQFVMRIPQSDISKYSRFEVRRLYNNLADCINSQQ